MITDQEDFNIRSGMKYTYRMIIGFDGSRAFLKERTGTEEYSYQLLKALSNIDRKNTYIIFLRKDAVLEKFPENFFFETIKWPRFWTQGGLALKTFHKKIDLLFVPSHTLPVIRKPFLKTVVAVHDLGSEYLPKMHQLKQRLYLSIMQRYQLKTATKIIAVSNATKNDLIKKVGIEEKKIKVVYEGYDNNLFQSFKDDLLVNSLRHFGIKKDIYILFMGTVQPRKNLERIIKAYSIVARHFLVARDFAPNLVIAGSKGWLSDEIYKLPKKLGIEDRVKFLGYVTDNQKAALYKGALALLYPSLFEGFGLPILEAQSCGCPVITSNISSMPEVAGKGAILVDPYSIDDIVKGMDKLHIGGNRDKLIKAGFKNIERFSWEKCARETLSVLEESAN